MRTIIVLMLGLLAGQVRGQTLVRIGYDDPSILRIAPGQMVTVFAAGLKTIITNGVLRASAIPFPTTLAGISVTLRQTLPASSRPIPMYSAEQFNRCVATPAPSSDCLLTALTVQIPFDLVVPNPLVESVTATGITTLQISENGSVSREFAVVPVPDQVHVLNSCDVNGTTRETGVCFPLVTHADGRLVLQAPRAADQIPLTASEAKPGETLIMYLFGMGVVAPAINAGDVTPVPPPTIPSPVVLRYEYSINASPSLPPGLPGGAMPLAPPPFAGLAPGQVGVYQVNFVVPAVPPGTQPCGSPVDSNLTVSVAVDQYGVRSFDGAAICIDPR